MAKYTILLLLCLLGLAIADDCSYDIYLSPSGNDTDNTGTDSDVPLLTIQAAINSLQNASSGGDWDGTGNVCLNFYPGTYTGAGNIGVTFQNYTFIVLYKSNDTADDQTVYFSGTENGGETGFIVNGPVEIDSRGDGNDDGQYIAFVNLDTAISVGANAENNTLFISNVVFNATNTGISAAKDAQIDNLIIGIQNSLFQAVPAPFTLYATGLSLLDLSNTNFNLSGVSSLTEVANVSMNTVDVANPTSGFFVGVVTASNYSVWQIESLTTNQTNSAESGSVFNIQANGGQFSIVDSYIWFASSAKSGGAIYLDGIDSVIGSDDSDSDSVTFNNNTAAVSGGAIFQNGGQAVVGSATFFGNTAPSGAAIEIQGNATLTLGHVDFESNTATDGFGIIDCCQNQTGCGTVSLNGTDYVFEDTNSSPNITCPGDIEYGSSFSEPPIAPAGSASSHQSNSETHWWAWLILALIIAAVIIAIIAGVAFWWFKKRQSGAYVTVE